jgi:hypothetical protein
MATAPQTAMDMPQEAANPYANPDTAAVYDQMRQSVSPKEFSDEVLAGASQVDPEEVAKFRAELEQLEVPMEVLDMLNNMVDEILANPDNYEQVKQKYEAMGVTDDLLPDAFDGEFFSALNMAVDQMIAEPAGAQAFAKGGIAELSPISKAVADYGRNGDTMLAHITPAEARMLRRRGGAGTTNPDTGLKEYFSLKKLFKGIGNAVKSFASSTVGKIVTTVALGFFLGPAAASFMGVGAGTAAAAAVNGFVGAAGSTLLGGGNLKDALKAGAIGGLTMGAVEGFSGAPLTGGTVAPGSFSDIVGGQVDKFTGMLKSPPFPEYTAQGALTDNATSNAAREAYAGELYKTNPEAFYNPIQAPSISATGEVAGMAPVSPEALNAQAPAASDFVPKKSSLIPDGQGGLKFPEGQTVGQTTLPGGQILTQNVPIEAPYDPATATRAVDFGYKPGGAGSAAYRPTTIGESFSKMGEGIGLGDGPASYKTFMEGAGDLFAPGPDNAQITARAREIMSTTPGSTLKDAMAAASKELSPGILRTYGPAAVAGIATLGAAGGFKPTQASASTLRPELMKPVTQRIAEGGNQRNYYIQGLPGVKYDQYGAPIFGQNMPLPTFETGLGITALMNPKGYAGGGLTGVSDVAKRVVDANNFDSTAYLNANPDVKAAIAKGEIADAYEHYTKYGQAEGRPAFDKAETAATAAKDAAEKEAAQAANRKAVADAKTAKKAAGFSSAYKNINAGLSYDAPAGIAATAIAARQAAFAPTMNKFTQAQAANAATLAKPYTPTVVDQPYNNTKGYTNVFNPVTTPVNYDTTPVGTTQPPVIVTQPPVTDKAAADKAAADKAAADKAAIAAADRARFQAQSKAIQNQQINEYLVANPTQTDQQYAEKMDYFGIAAPQVAEVVGMQNLPTNAVQSINARYAQAAAANAGDPAAIAAQAKANAVTGQSIQDYFAKNPGMTDTQIASYMDANQIDPGQMYRAFAGTPGEVSGADIFARYQAAQKPPAAGGGQTFIPDPRLPEGMMGTTGGTGYDPVTGRMDLGTAGGSGQYVRRPDSLPTSPAAGNDFKHMAMTDEFGNIITAPPTPPQTKLLNMGGIASLGSGGYPRRTGQISGPGTATSDSIPAMLSDGEFVMTAKAVRGAGKGDKRAGAKRMYALMNQLEKNAARG